MSNTMEASARRAVTLGARVAAKIQTLSGAATHQLFTVTGGNVLITAMWGKCTVEMAGANTVNLQSDPTTGDTVVLVTATDLGTTNTVVGTLIGVTPENAGAISLAKGRNVLKNWPVPIGEVESAVTGAGADGAIQWYCTWIPLDDDAVLTASA